MTFEHRHYKINCRPVEILVHETFIIMLRSISPKVYFRNPSVETAAVLFEKHIQDYITINVKFLTL